MQLTQDTCARRQRALVSDPFQVSCRDSFFCHGVSRTMMECSFLASWMARLVLTAPVGHHRTRRQMSLSILCPLRGTSIRNKTASGYPRWTWANLASSLL